MSRQTITKTGVEIKGRAVSIDVHFSKFENKALQGFASIVVKEGEEIFMAFNDLQVVKAKDGNLFISEPKSYPKKEDGTLDFDKGFPISIAPKAFKELATTEIAKLLNTTTTV